MYCLGVLVCDTKLKFTYTRTAATSIHRKREPKTTLKKKKKKKDQITLHVRVDEGVDLINTFYAGTKRHTKQQKHYNVLTLPDFHGKCRAETRHNRYWHTILHPKETNRKTVRKHRSKYVSRSIPLLLWMLKSPSLFLAIYQPGTWYEELLSVLPLLSATATTAHIV